MALTLIVEDGSLVANANTYATYAQVQSYNALRGLAVAADKNTLITQMIAAMDYIETMELRWVGDRVAPLTQALSWPRANAFLFDNPRTAMIASNVIPVWLPQAQSYLCSVINSGVDLYAVQDSRAVIKEVIGPLETDYDPKYGATFTPIIPNLDAILRPIMRAGAGMLTSVRL